MKLTLFIFIALISLVLSGCSQEADINDALNNAKKEGRMVMLELGSVGCRPCEQMKPVMEKLRTNYGGKLEVFFVDVRKDRDTAQKFGVYVIPTQVFLDKNGRNSTGIWAFTDMKKSYLS
jgi:thioredoxin 1